jgi:hypothetical protein
MSRGADALKGRCTEGGHLAAPALYSVFLLRADAVAPAPARGIAQVASPPTTGLFRWMFPVEPKNCAPAFGPDE